MLSEIMTREQWEAAAKAEKPPDAKPKIGPKVRAIRKFTLHLMHAPDFALSVIGTWDHYCVVRSKWMRHYTAVLIDHVDHEPEAAPVEEEV